MIFNGFITSTPFQAVSTSAVSIFWRFMVFCNRLLLRIIRIPRYRQLYRSAYHAKEIPLYTSVPVFLLTPTFAYFYTFYIGVYFHKINSFVLSVITNPISKTYLYNFDPLITTYKYVVKLGFTGVYITRVVQ